ncbi:MAG: protein-S-isoprenylcysteine methyltransferase-like [Parcubacteria group bacterium Athens0416_74]|nr:MAG: protein-S-isoprenylcysteine methyltransferase-like [Parcubacteria group bacterium Athens0416_74]
MRAFFDGAFKKKFAEFLRHPIVDKMVGVIAISPMIFTLSVFAERALEGYINLYGSLMALNQVLIVGFTLVRRVPVRVSTNPLYWFITAGRTYWTFVVFYYIAVWPSVAIVPGFVTQALLVLSIAIIIWARLSLGRSIGFIPAQRRIVSTGIYAYLRHPIHIGYVLFLLSFMLQSFSTINCVIIGIGIVFTLAKSFIEERFLCESHEYQVYCDRVRYRWIPYVA